MPEPDHVEHHHHYDKPAHSKVDLIFGALAIFLSGVSVYIAISQSKSMERQVAAATWPNITFSTSNQAPDGTDRISLDLTNTGVGPARLEAFELFYKGTPMHNLAALSKACCEAGESPIHKASITTSTVLGEVLPARDNITLIALRRNENAPALWDILNRERFNVRVRICYCSVVDECWAADSGARRPERVNQCAPSQPIQFE